MVRVICHEGRAHARVATLVPMPSIPVSVESINGDGNATYSFKYKDVSDTYVAGIIAKHQDYQEKINKSFVDALNNTDMRKITPVFADAYKTLSASFPTDTEERVVFRRAKVKDGKLVNSLAGCRLADWPALPVPGTVTEMHGSSYDGTVVYKTKAMRMKGIDQSKISETIAKVQKVMKETCFFPKPLMDEMRLKVKKNVSFKKLFPKEHFYWGEKNKENFSTGLYYDELFLTNLALQHGLFTEKNLKHASMNRASHPLLRALSTFFDTSEDPNLESFLSECHYMVIKRGEYYVIVRSSSPPPEFQLHMRASRVAEAPWRDLRKSFQKEFALFAQIPPGAKKRFLLFTTTWCGHCKKLKKSDTWKEVIAPLSADGSLEAYDLEEDVGDVHGVHVAKWDKRVPVEVDGIPTLLLTLGDGQVYRAKDIYACNLEGMREYVSAM